LRRFNAAMTIMVCAAVVALAYWYERGYRRWANNNTPSARRGPALRGARTTYRDRRALVTELARAIRG
jgi:hypothetical protein